MSRIDFLAAICGQGLSLRVNQQEHSNFIFSIFTFIHYRFREGKGSGKAMHYFFIVGSNYLLVVVVVACFDR